MGVLSEMGSVEVGSWCNLVPINGDGYSKLGDVHEEVLHNRLDEHTTTW